MKKVLILMVAISFYSISCQKSKDSIIPDSNISLFPVDTPEANIDQEMVLGEKLENPYTVENMQKAYDNLQKGSRTTGTVKIEPNYLYIRFLPKNLGEYNLIHRNKELELFDHPLDQEIKTNGHKYKDPATKGQPYTWYYCAVKINFKIPKEVTNEILAELFLPVPNDKSINSLSEEAIGFRRELEREALTITGNTPNTKNGRIAGYNPSGTIKMRDNVLGDIGMDGVTVRANRWFTTYTTLSNKDGSFKMNNTFENPCNYSIKWERDDFDILEGGTLANFQAYYNGPKQSGAWNDIITGGMSLMYATIHRAAIRYYYINNELRTPRNGSYFDKLSIAAYDWENVGLNADHETSAFLKSWLDRPDIRVFKPSRGPYAIYSTTIHELAHAANWAMDRSNFRNSDLVIIESWARCVQWHFTNKEYSPVRPNWADGIQTVVPSSTNYTPIFIDIVDNINQRVKYGNSNLPNDNVNSYTVRQIEDILVGSTTLLNLRTNLTNTYTNPTKANINELFKGYGIN